MLGGILWNNKEEQNLETTEAIVMFWKAADSSDNIAGNLQDYSEKTRKTPQLASILMCSVTFSINIP